MTASNSLSDFFAKMQTEFFKNGIFVGMNFDENPLENIS